MYRELLATAHVSIDSGPCARQLGRALFAASRGRYRLGCQHVMSLRILSRVDSGRWAPVGSHLLGMLLYVSTCILVYLQRKRCLSAPVTSPSCMVLRSRVDPAAAESWPNRWPHYVARAQSHAQRRAPASDGNPSRCMA